MRIVIDASIAVKWVVTEDGTDEAVSLLSGHHLSAPDLLIAECANILWKKVRLTEMSADEAMVAMRIIQRANLELCPMRSLMEPAAKLAIDLDHPAYDCVYLALAMSQGWQFVTSDARFLEKVRQSSPAAAQSILSLKEVAGGSGERH
ncbi:MULTISPECIES: type II toxin-antitoxin system VapC family toxin [Sphingomonadales]|jgi:predicted nucleic acid-binding protein|uniref:Putative nucleic acid-binding protein n=1 Tax=Hephaestia caeni TaxID=645617 RepID=A0A397PBX7_9SPHN|nr:MULTISPECIES: type II toxin-antitoxin system VapC family toxin [Sphingomonadaceae]RIA45903.1 putative nucleic acid-binding protein [Hephaestia caeni]WQE08248.1 type II toxin-antitoxin system VapC family toxin [Sphingobium yanoikuyae]